MIKRRATISEHRASWAKETSQGCYTALEALMAFNSPIRPSWNTSPQKGPQASRKPNFTQVTITSTFCTKRLNKGPKVWCGRDLRLTKREVVITHQSYKPIPMLALRLKPVVVAWYPTRASASWSPMATPTTSPASSYSCSKGLWRASAVIGPRHPRRSCLTKTTSSCSQADPSTRSPSKKNSSWRHRRVSQSRVTSSARWSISSLPLTNITSWMITLPLHQSSQQLTPTYSTFRK